MIANPLAFAAADLPRASEVDWVIFVPVTAALVSLIIRFRRARGDERQQLKWFAYGAGLMVLLAMTGSLRFPRADTLSSALTLGLLPVAAGVAILRYRLYDIDRPINRTLVYGALTALLGTVYVAAVLVLFQPVRGRTQAVVDRRFNRRRYDAAKTIQAFSTRLRDQIDLDTLSTELLAVVDQTMEPTQVSLWRRPPRLVPSSAHAEVWD